MNLALILHALSANNGISRVVLSLTREFSKRGHTTHIYASRLLLSEKGIAALPENVFLHSYPCLRGSNRIWAAPFGALLPFLNRSHDLVVSHMLTVWQDVIVMNNDPQPVELERMSGVPFTIDRPRLRTKNRFLRTFVEKKRFDPARYKSVVAVSRRSAAGIAAAYGVPEDRLTVIRHGVDAVYFSPEERRSRRGGSRAALDIAPDDLVFVYIGDSWKGLEFAIKGIALSRCAGRCVLIAAGPFHEKRFYALAAEKGLRLICNNEWRDIRDLYGAGDVFINPTPMDTFGLALLEAMSMGLAVITTQYAGVSELLKDGENAFILENPWDTEAIAEIADRLAESGFRERVSGLGAELAAGLSWERPALEHLAVYEKTIRVKGKG
jgi:glycosyltransferase involved in cell wall biosynthesis